MGKNLQKVQDMLDGNYKNKIQVGYSKGEKTRKVGERWIDSDGIEWEQKHGYYSKVTKLANVGIFSRVCKDCDKGITNNIDKEFHSSDGRCYHCQLNYEMDLKADKWLRWFCYRRLKDLQNMDAIEKQMIQWIDEMEKQRKENPFDETIANSLANEEVNLQVNKVTNKLI